MTDQPTAEVLPPSGSAIAEYSPTEAALAEMRAQLQAHGPFDCSTPEGDREARQTRLALVRLRTSLDEKRLELKRPLLERGKKLDDEAKRITAQIVEMELPIDQVIRAEEARKAEIKAAEERRERARRAAQEAVLGEIERAPMAYLNSHDLDAIILGAQALRDRDLSELDADLRDRAEHLRRAAIGQLAGIEQRERDRRDQEARIAAEQAENARIRQEAAQRAEAQRQRDLALNTISNASRGLLTTPVHELRARRDWLQGRDLASEIHPDDLDIAQELRDGAMRDLEAAIAQADEREATRQREESARAELEQLRRAQAERDEAERIAREQDERAQRAEDERREREADEQAQRARSQQWQAHLATITLEEAATHAAELIESEFSEDHPIAQELRAALAGKPAQAPKPARKPRAKKAQP